MYARTMSYPTASEINTAMAGVYFQMMLAVLTSLVVSSLVASSEAAMALLFGTALKWVVIFAPLVAVFAVSAVMHKVDKPAALALLHGFAALMGLSLAAVMASFTTASIVSAFAGAAVLFAVMSFYGYFTKKDLDSWGKWLFVGLIAIIIVSIINIFIGSGPLQMAVSAMAVVIFMGLTAYDTQRIREAVTERVGGNAEIYGALSLYINFINLFTSLLSLFGNRE